MELPSEQGIQRQRKNVCTMYLCDVELTLLNVQNVVSTDSCNQRPTMRYTYLSRDSLFVINESCFTFVRRKNCLFT